MVGCHPVVAALPPPSSQALGRVAGAPRAPPLLRGQQSQPVHGDAGSIQQPLEVQVQVERQLHQCEYYVKHPALHVADAAQAAASPSGAAAGAGAVSDAAAGMIPLPLSAMSGQPGQAHLLRRQAAPQDALQHAPQQPPQHLHLQQQTWLPEETAGTAGLRVTSVAQLARRAALADSWRDVGVLLDACEAGGLLGPRTALLLLLRLDQLQLQQARRQQRGPQLLQHEQVVLQRQSSSNPQASRALLQTQLCSPVTAPAPVPSTADEVALYTSLVQSLVRRCMTVWPAALQHCSTAAGDACGHTDACGAVGALDAVRACVGPTHYMITPCALPVAPPTG